MILPSFLKEKYMKMYDPNNWSYDQEEYDNLIKIDALQVSGEAVGNLIKRISDGFSVPEKTVMKRLFRLLRQFYSEMEERGEKISLEDMVKVRYHALTEVERLLTLDIPLYQRVFEQMDEELSQEVYLGRDGIFAYEARRFQHRSRKAARIPSRRSRPKYLVYSRAYKDDIGLGSKYFYLRKQGVTENSRFFDTGFSGSIPEDILKSLGKDIKDEQIIMLSAKKESRRCKNISENMRDSIVDEIEHRPKMVYSSKGFDEEYNPIEEEAHPISRFIYRVVRLALRYRFYTNPRSELLPLENIE